ncbi:Sapep family Mn(2+)-dependent dipeptidase [candidate division WOR-3 bacterium]|nr:Sapep family Mn(2+)-dependent dipeptidase [candidate division WOR-3 bacterium]
MNQIDSHLDSVKDNLISDIQLMLRIPSVKSSPLPGAPFGKEIASAFETSLAIGKKLGLQTFTKDGHYVFFQSGTKGTMGAVLCHVDVVPAEKGWKHPPFSGTVESGKLFGRGVEDNKGPAVCALYALYLLQKTDKIRGRLRVILGGDEETGWDCVENYKKNEEHPAWAITPDSQFPVIYAEKNISRFSFSTPLKSDLVKSISGGSAVNMVPDWAVAVLDEKAPMETLKKTAQEYFAREISIEEKNGEKSISAHGKSAHASVPEKGKNAFSELFSFLSRVMPEEDPFRGFVEFYNGFILGDHNGKKLGVYFKDDVSGELTLNPGVLETKKGRIALHIDVRSPVTVSEDDLRKAFMKIQYPNIEITQGKFVPGLHVPENSPLVSTLLEIYRKNTKDLTPPVAIGGGTYARAFKNTVAFGPVFPWRENMAHQSDEYMHIEDIFLFTKILAQSLCELDKKYSEKKK